MSFLLKNRIHFSILFFSILILDVIFISIPELKVFRLVSKPLILISLILFYYLNNRNQEENNFWFVMFALSFFFIGDLLLIHWENNYLFTFGMMCFVVGKIGYMLRFSHQRDFKLLQILPFLIFCFVYVIVIMNFMHAKIEGFFVPVMIYFFASVLLLMLAYLRKSDVNSKSYALVFIGLLLSMIYDGLSGIAAFGTLMIPYVDGLIMFFYGLSQYLIIIGILNEEKLPEHDLII